ncbi:MAG: hypothetical protein KDB22_27090 [Planctomycetales bacterium]|nr:hypothetical protein [Planctomycetales bacterium]
MKPWTEGLFKNWQAALPALVVGGSAALIVLVAINISPKRMPGYYKNRLEKARQTWLDLDSQRTANVDQMRQVAAELDIIYERLVGMELGEQQRYWDWAILGREQSARFISMLADSDANLSDEQRAGLQDDAIKYRNKSQKILEQLADGQSPFAARALIHVAADKLSAVADGNVSGNLNDMATRLAFVVERADADNSQVTDQNTAAATAPDELDDARLLLVRLALESAWELGVGQSQDDNSRPTESEQVQPFRVSLPASSRLLPSQDRLGVARLYWNQQSAKVESISLGWRAAEQVLNTFQSSGDSERSTRNLQTDYGEVIQAAGSSKVRWEDRFAEIQLASIDCDWKEVAFLLARQNTTNDRAVRHSTAELICRLSTSRLLSESESWRAKYISGLALVLQLEPYMPEFSELLWRCSVAKAYPDSENIVVSPELPTAIASGASPVLQHTIFTLSSTISGQQELAKTHLQLLLRTGGSSATLGSVILWLVRSNDFDSDSELALDITQLLQDACALEPKNGINWFALGVLQVKLGSQEQALEALREAQELLGELPAIEEMLSAAKQLATL